MTPNLGLLADDVAVLDACKITASCISKEDSYIVVSVPEGMHVLHKRSQSFSFNKLAFMFTPLIRQTSRETRFLVSL